jgi:hypothetical protein
MRTVAEAELAGTLFKEDFAAHECVRRVWLAVQAHDAFHHGLQRGGNLDVTGIRNEAPTPGSCSYAFASRMHLPPATHCR